MSIRSLLRQSRTWISDLATSRFGVLIVLAIASVLSLSDRNFGYFFAIGVVLVIAKEKSWDWSYFGFGQRWSARSVFVGVGLGVLMFALFAVVDAFVQFHLGEFDLSSMEDIEGNLVGFVILMVIMWIFAAFGEELLFRGYYMNRIAHLFGGSSGAWMLSAFLISAYFGISHAYQGPAGIISTGFGGLCFSAIYYFNRDNLTLAALCHGVSNSIAITMIYLGNYGAFNAWVTRLLF